MAVIVEFSFLIKCIPLQWHRKTELLRLINKHMKPEKYHFFNNKSFNNKVINNKKGYLYYYKQPS